MAKRPPRQPGYPWMIPYLIVKDAEATIDFYQRAFGFEKGMVMPGPDGKARHVEMVYRDAMIMFGPESAATQWETKSPISSGVLAPISLYVYCDDVDALHARAVAAGAESVRAPETMFYGDRVCTLKDPSGFWWSFGTNVADFDPSKAS